MKLKIETGCIENPMYDSHRRAKNWVATVTIDKKSPGGLAREFWGRGTGAWVEIPDNLKIGDMIEFAGDYYSGSGRKNARRQYARLTAIEENTMFLFGPFDSENDFPPTPPKASDNTAEQVLSTIVKILGSEKTAEEKLALIKIRLDMDMENKDA